MELHIGQPGLWLVTEDGTYLSGRMLDDPKAKELDLSALTRLELMLLATRLRWISEQVQWQLAGTEHPQALPHWGPPPVQYVPQQMQIPTEQ